MMNYLLRFLFCFKLLTFPVLSSATSSSLFEAMDAYEKGHMTKEMDEIFLSYIGKSTPIAEPFINAIIEKRRLNIQNPQEEEGYDEREKAKEWFNAINLRSHYLDLMKRKPSKFTKAVDMAVRQENGPLVYILGTIYEREKMISLKQSQRIKEL